jgi:hypothetical protein
MIIPEGMNEVQDDYLRVKKLSVVKLSVQGNIIRS